MKLLIVLSLSALCLAASEPQSKDRAPQTKPKPAPTVIKPVEIPAGAVESEPGTFTYTDAAGKKWIYRKTPFGVSKAEDKPAARRPDLPEAADFINVTDAGDSLKFERPGPFGTYKWEKKKTELNPDENAAWERTKTKAAGKQE